MFLQRIDAGIYGVNCYIIADDINRLAAVSHSSVLSTPARPIASSIFADVIVS